MPTEEFTRPADQSVSRVNDEVAVGEDLEFQNKWWKFENAVWVVFAVILLLDLAGVFGRGPLARTRKVNSDQTLDVHYERIERTGTPSVMRIQFGPQAIHNGQIKLFVSESVVKELGAQRVIPAPLTSAVGNGGITYTFPASQLPASVEFSLEPSAPGYFHFGVQVPGAAPLEATVAVVP